MRTLPIFEFDTAKLAPLDRLDAVSDLWRNYLSINFFEGAKNDFFLKSKVWWTGDCTFVHSAAAPMILGRKTPPEGEKLISISILTRGLHKYVVQDEFKQQTREAVHMSRHADQKIRCCPTNSEFFVLYIPAARLGISIDEDFPSRTFPINTPAGSIILSMLLGLHQSLEDADYIESFVLSESIISFLESIVHNSVRFRSLMTASTRSADIYRYIDENIKDHSLSADRLCKEFGMSRPALYRLFNETGGVMAYIAKRRTKFVMEELSRSKPQWGLVRSVAEEFGFHDITTFNRVFRRHTGVAPGMFSGLYDEELKSVLPTNSVLSADTGRPPIVLSNASNRKIE